MLSHSDNETASVVARKSGSIAWQLCRMTLRGLTRCLLLFLVFVIPYIQLSTATAFSGFIDGRVFGCRFAIDDTGIFLILGSGLDEDRFVTAEFSDTEGTLPTTRCVAEIFGAGGSAFDINCYSGFGVAWFISPLVYYWVFSLNHFWVVGLTFLLFWFVDGRRILRGIQMRRRIAVSA